MLSCSSVTEIGSFDSKRKPLVLFLGPFLGSFFHQSLEWFLFVLFLTVLAFTHVSRSLYLGWIGCMENNASPIDLCRLTHLHRRVNDHSEKPPSVIGAQSELTPHCSQSRCR
jgi:hypothetical protein